MLRRTSLALRMHHPCGISLAYAPYEKSINSCNFFHKSFCFRRQNPPRWVYARSLWSFPVTNSFCMWQKAGHFQGEKYTDRVPNLGSTYIYFPTLNCLSWSHLMCFGVSVALLYPLQPLPLRVCTLMHVIKCIGDLCLIHIFKALRSNLRTVHWIVIHWARLTWPMDENQDTNLSAKTSWPRMKT